MIKKEYFLNNIGMRVVILKYNLYDKHTKRRKPPNAIQNTRGPARSESSITLASVCCNGFNTVFVYKMND